MALTLTQQAQVRLYLGWSDRFNSDDRLDMAFGALSAEAETLVVAELAKLTALDTAMVAARARFKALKVGTIELSGAQELGLLRSQGRESVGRIATIMGVPVNHDVFSGSGPKSWAGFPNYYRMG